MSQSQRNLKNAAGTGRGKMKWPITIRFAKNETQNVFRRLFV